MPPVPQRLTASQRPAQNTCIAGVGEAIRAWADASQEGDCWLAYTYATSTLSPAGDKCFAVCNTQSCSHLSCCQLQGLPSYSCMVACLYGAAAAAGEEVSPARLNIKLDALVGAGSVARHAVHHPCSIPASAPHGMTWQGIVHRAHCEKQRLDRLFIIYAVHRWPWYAYMRHTCTVDDQIVRY